MQKQIGITQGYCLGCNSMKPVREDAADQGRTQDADSVEHFLINDHLHHASGERCAGVDTHPVYLDFPDTRTWTTPLLPRTQRDLDEQRRKDDDRDLY